MKIPPIGNSGSCFAYSADKIKFGNNTAVLDNSIAVLPNDIFIRQDKETNTEIFPNKKFTVKDYYDLTFGEKENLYSKIPDTIRELAFLNADIGIIFKYALDEEFGEGNYKFISLGTSPACVGKAMEYMGEDVVYLPMSFSKHTIAKPWLEESPYIDFYKEYMEEKRFSNKHLIEENKVGVLCDYIFTGRSFELSCYMLTDLLDIDKNLTEAVTMNSIIENSSLIDDDIKAEYLNELLKNEKTADFTDVPHFSFLDDSPVVNGEITDYGSFKNNFDKYKGHYSNSHNFCMMKILDEAGFLNIPASPAS